MDKTVNPVSDASACRGSDPCSAQLQAPLHIPTLDALAAKGRGDTKGVLDWLCSQADGSTSVAQKTVPAPSDAATRAPGHDDNPTASLPAPPVSAGQSLPGDSAVAVIARPRAVLSALLAFFNDRVPAIVKQRGWEINATAFVAYVMIRIKVSVQADSYAERRAILVCRDTSRRDAVRFAQLWSSVVEYLLTRAMLVTHAGGVPLALRTPSSLLLEEDWDGVFFSGAEVDWSSRVASAFQAVASPIASSREEGLQMLASWATGIPESRIAIAEELAARLHLLPVWQQLPLAELYPLSVILKYATLQDATLLAGPVGSILPSQTLGLPDIVAREVHEILENMGRMLGHAFRRVP
mmetsp:Transcript_18828/g.53195  ORF Transcript_18828/g.53195 Transcript_18828/m.53195 type:complete len:353 (-) Transcript_18828:328-1386(-)